MSHTSTETFAAAWIDSWNRSDLDALLAHYRDDVIFTSPRAATLTGSAVIYGIPALRDYWSAALQRATARHFTLDHVIWDPARSELAIIYVNTVDGTPLRACELMRFDEQGLIVSGEALYGARQ